MYCGIDVSKGKSNVCILDRDKNVKKEFSIKHDKEGFEELEKHIKEETKIGMEVTGNYCKALYLYLKPKYDVCYVDNYQMNIFSKLQNPNLKNDRVDAKLIAIYLSSGMKKIDAEKFDELKDLSRLYQKTLKQLTRYKYMFSDLVSIIFPELENAFLLRTGKTVWNLLLHHPTPEQILDLSDEEIETAMRKGLTKHGSLTYKEKTIKKIKKLAEKSIGVKDYPTACFQYTIKIMIFYQDVVNDIKKRIEQSLLQTPYHSLLKEFGLNTVGLATIVGEVGDIRRFSNYKKFVSFCGFDVSEKQSGSYKSVNCYITKRGNRILRFTFYNLVLTHLRYKTELSKFFYRLRDEKGKHAKKCMVATARKLAVKTYFNMMRCHE